VKIIIILFFLFDAVLYVSDIIIRSFSYMYIFLLTIYGNLFVTDDDVSHLPFTHLIDVSQLSFMHLPFVQTSFAHIEDWL
jgi:hypothetical protein